jgi:hypothetical protein
MELNAISCPRLDLETNKQKRKLAEKLREF